MIDLQNTARHLAEGKSTSRDLVEQCLDKISDPDGEGERTFILVDAKSARAQADAMDRLRGGGVSLSPLAGIPISIKDLFDIRGQVTSAGSKVLAETPPAKEDATIVKRLRQAGMVILGRTNMTEFAYSGLGLNPHHGTPLNPYDRKIGRIPGGSSAGAAVSVTDGMALAAIGTDTGGSCRIPAAMCGLTGFKPTALRVPLAGVLPLSNSLDSVGPLAPTVTCCAMLDAVLSGGEIYAPPQVSIARLRIGILTNYVTDDIDDTVGRTYEAALNTLSKAGVSMTDIKLADLDTLPELNAKGGFVAAEAYALHRDLLRDKADQYDPRVSTRMLKGAEQSAADYIDLLTARRDIIARTAVLAEDFDAIIYPTIPIIAPALADLEDEEAYGRINLLALRNPTVTNFLNRCGISLPIAKKGLAPVGLMIMGHAGKDEALFSIARTIEKILAGNV